MKHMERIIEHLVKISRFHLLLLAIVIAEILTAMVVSGMSILIYGRVLWDYIVTGAVAALVVSLIVVYLLVLLIEEIRKGEESLRKSENRYRAIVENQAEFVVRYLAGGIVTFVNDTLCRYVNMKREELLGKSYYPFMHPDDREAFIRKIEALNPDTHRMIAEARVVLPDGRMAWHLWSHHAIFNDQGNLVEYQGTGRDITERKLAEEEILTAKKQAEQLARTDTLTGVDNRRSFIDTAEEEFIRSRRFNHPMSVLMIDIDQFKRINDTHSHAAGDEVLKSFAMTIRCALRNVDHFGRIGGEEFSAILIETSIGQAMDTAERIRRIVESGEVQFGDKTIRITASLGIAEIESGDDGFANTLARADMAMYQAKKAGRNCIKCSE